MKLNTKKTALLSVIVFVPVGFFFASFLFRALTVHQSPDTSHVAIDQIEKIVLPSSLPLPSAPERAAGKKLVKAQEVVASPSSSAVEEQLRDVQEDAVDFDLEDEVDETVFPPLRVNGIFASDAGNMALINDVVLKEGDSLLGATVVRIHANYVEMEMNGETKVVRVK